MKKILIPLFFMLSLSACDSNDSTIKKFHITCIDNGVEYYNESVSNYYTMNGFIKVRTKNGKEAVSGNCKVQVIKNGNN